MHTNKYLTVYVHSYVYCIYYLFAFPKGSVPDSPVLRSETIYDRILVSWSPVGSNKLCGPVTYSITIKPPHGLITMIDDTVYSITGLCRYYTTAYIITVYATNTFGDGEPTTKRVWTTHCPSGSY